MSTANNIVPVPLLSLSSKPLTTVGKRSGSTIVTASSKRSRALSIGHSRPQPPRPEPRQQAALPSAARRHFHLGVLSPSPPRNRATKTTKRPRASESSSRFQDDIQRPGHAESSHTDRRPLPRPRVLSIASPSPNKRRVVIAETPVDNKENPCFPYRRR